MWNNPTRASEGLTDVDSDEPEGCRIEKQRVMLFGMGSYKQGVIPRLSVHPDNTPRFTRSKCAQMSNPAESLRLRTDRTIGESQQKLFFALLVVTFRTTGIIDATPSK